MPPLNGPDLILRRISPIGQPPRRANGGKGIGDGSDAFCVGAFEGAGNVFWVLGRRGRCENGGDGADLFGHRFGPGDDIYWCGGGDFA